MTWFGKRWWRRGSEQNKRRETKEKADKVYPTTDTNHGLEY